VARKPRIDFSGALYHVIARGNQGQRVFQDDRDLALYQQLLAEYKGQCHCSVYAYALMPNHIHILIETGQISLSRLMHRLQFRYTLRANLKYKTHGHLFQGRYKAILCDKDAYLLELSAYIHLNPVRAGLVEDPSDYAWSSYRSYIKTHSEHLADTSYLLSQFSLNPQVARNRYRRFVEDRLDQGHRDDFYVVKEQRLLGDESFVERIHRAAKQEAPHFYEVSLPELVSCVSSALELPEDILLSSSRNRKGALGRALVAYLGRELGRLRLKDVAEYFKRDPAAISQAIRRIEDGIQEEGILSKVVHKIESRVTNGRKKKYLIT
jgi:putative transposase